MAAAKCNYLVLFDNSPQVYTSASLDTIIDSPPPKNSEDAKRSILFVSYFPDTKELKVFEVSDEEVEAKRIEVAETLARREAKRQAKIEADAESQTPDTTDNPG